MELFKLKKGSVTLDEVPEAPDDLDEYGEEAWEMYCQILIDQNRLYKEYLIALNQLCWLEQELAKERKETTGEYTRVIKEFSVEARQYRKAYGLTEESRPEIESKKPKKDNDKSSRASGWNN